MLIKILFDLFIYLLSFKIVEYFKRGTLEFITPDSACIILILLSVLVSSLLVGKYKVNNSKEFFNAIKPNFYSFVLSMGIVTVYLNLLSDSTPSRIIIGGSILLGFFIELFLKLLHLKSYVKSDINLNIKISPLIFLYELFLFTAVVYYAYANYTDISLSRDIYSISLLFVIWIASGFFTHQLIPPDKNLNYWYFIWARIKGYILLIALTSIMVYFLLPEGLTLIYPFYISIIYSFSSFTVNTLYFILIHQGKTDETVTKIVRATVQLDEPLLQSDNKYVDKYSLNNPFNHYLTEQLSEVYLKKYKDVYMFINESLDLFSFDFRKCFMIRSADTFNIEVLPENYLELYMNLHQLNDIRRINQYLISVNSKLINGGVFVGAVEPISLRKNRFIQKYPYFIASFFYFFDFIWKRFFPKMPFLKEIYFALTRGQNRAISLSETLGRLFYCGFDTLSIKKIGTLVYFIAVKKKEPLSDESPSYGPFIKLKRVGKNGTIINVYKFRTMYPYSEYLQKFIYDKANLQEGGKFNNDFRVTSWGRVLRKLWIDEWPMLINYFKGQLKLIGVRPLSIQYFNLYPEYLRKKRIKFKPGLVPPFYKDLPKTFDEIIASEEKYLDNYEKHPLLTDINYFFHAAYNILINSARSK